MKKIKKMNKDIKSVKGLSSGLIKMVGSLIGAIITTIAKILYIIVYNFNNLCAKLYMKAPRIARVLLIYALIGGVALNFIAPKTRYIEKSNTSIATIYAKANNISNEVSKIKVATSNKKEEVKQEKKEVATTSNIKFTKVEEEKIYNMGLQMGLTQKQSLLAIAISKSETGHWTSPLYKNNNNFGGMYNTKENRFFKYNTNEEGLKAYISMLKNVYFSKGLDTPEKIQPIYAPINAKNDPQNLNSNWLRVVSEFYNQYVKMM